MPRPTTGRSARTASCASIAVALVLVVSLAGCRAASQPVAAPPARDEAAQVTLSSQPVSTRARIHRVSTAHTSTNAPPGELFELAQAVAQVKPGRITTCVIDGRIGFVGAASVVFPDAAQARRWGRETGPDATLRRC